MAGAFKTSKAELVAIYRLEFYKKQKNWKFCSVERQKAEERKAAKNAKAKFNLTYDIEPNPDKDIEPPEIYDTGEKETEGEKGVEGESVALQEDEVEDLNDAFVETGSDEIITTQAPLDPPNSPYSPKWSIQHWAAHCRLHTKPTASQEYSDPCNTQPFDMETNCEENFNYLENQNYDTDVPDMGQDRQFYPDVPHYGDVYYSPDEILYGEEPLYGADVPDSVANSPHSAANFNSRNLPQSGANYPHPGVHYPHSTNSPLSGALPHFEASFPRVRTNIQPRTNLPKFELTFPHTKTGLPYFEPSIPHSRSNVPHSRALPLFEGTFPHSTTSIPPSDTNVPQYEANFSKSTNSPHPGALPHFEATFPRSRTNMPQSGMNMPPPVPNIPHSSMSIPHFSPNLPHSVPIIPNSGLSIHLSGPNMPHSGSNTPHSKPNLPLSSDPPHQTNVLSVERLRGHQQWGGYDIGPKRWPAQSQVWTNTKEEWKSGAVPKMTELPVEVAMTSDPMKGGQAEDWLGDTAQAQQPGEGRFRFGSSTSSALVRQSALQRSDSLLSVSSASFVRGAARAPHSTETDLRAADYSDVSMSPPRTPPPAFTHTQVPPHPRQTYSFEYPAHDAGAAPFPLHNTIPTDVIITGSFLLRPDTDGTTGVGRGRGRRTKLIGIGMGRPYRL